MSGAEAPGSVPGWRIGSVRGVPVYLGRSWPVIALVIVALFGPQLHDQRPDLGGVVYVVAAGYALLLLVSVLVHEASHALMGQARGYHVSRIVADLWGGHTAYEHADTSPMSSALVAVVGPLSNGVLALLSWLALPMTPDGIPQTLVAVLAWSNTLVAGFNLLPGLPLDGGHLVDALVWKVTGSRAQGMVVAGWCGRGVTVLVLAWALVLPFLRGSSPSLFTVAWAVFLATFLWVGATSAIRAGAGLRVVGRVTVRSVARPVRIAPDSAVLGDLPVERPEPVAVHHPDRGVWGLLDEQAVGAVPESARAVTTLGSVSRAQPAGWVVEVGSFDADVAEVVAGVQASGAERIVVVSRAEPPEVGLVDVGRLAAALHRADGDA
ncbi:site-2 protease family protein [Luteipulveratus halotolerans]|uniref:site-2 protease family protein n=1 Tax=Luteipulveratus halotolerans TaxID=1631356 RepID=UPI000681CE88|nr:site-2 protease family protein [Luteipulveratus halotolerans]